MFIRFHPRKNALPLIRMLEIELIHFQILEMVLQLYLEPGILGFFENEKFVEVGELYMREHHEIFFEHVHYYELYWGVVVVFV